MSRVAETLVAGKELGTTERTVRRLELTTDREDIVTAAGISDADSTKK